ncbi:MAG TPA: ABC transporter permease [Geminicoccaceae bacterium]|nr:ABC transporter permease [Geminicoccus sp.]HMU50852.1 ABC transporter permease [Geminicoccaceae bacterium]
MHLYVLRRLLHLLPVLLITSSLVFSILLLLPGDPTYALLGENATAGQRQAMREKMGFDQPIPVQYARWLGSTLSGDFGRSLRTQEPVADMLATRVPVTLQLTVMSIILSVLIGMPAGIVAALGRNTWIDVAASVVAMGGMALPYFWAGILLIMLFSLQLGWLPPSGYVPLTVDPLQNLKLMILPTLTIGTAMAALVMRQTRTSMLQVLSEDYVRTARAKGAGEPRVVIRHALRNALIPVITVIGLQTGALVSGAVVTETIFSLPGLGRMVVEGIFERDLAPVQAGILVIVVGVLLINLITDLAYTGLDRRIRL